MRTMHTERSAAAIVALIALLSTPVTLAHEGDPDGHAPAGRVTDDGGNEVDGSVVVPGTVAALKAMLFHVERWPEVFTDARAVEPREGEPWSLDFVHFQHPHSFVVHRGGRGVSLTLAEQGHGEARLEYSLEPLDAQRSILRVRFVMTTPEGFTREQTVALLKRKAEVDLEDFARAASTAAGSDRGARR